MKIISFQKKFSHNQYSSNIQQNLDVLSCIVVVLSLIFFSPLTFKSELKSLLKSFMCIFTCGSVGIIFLNFH